MGKEEDPFEQFIKEIERLTPAHLEYGLGYYPYLLNMTDAREYAKAKLDLDAMRKETYLRQTMSPEQAALISPDIIEEDDYLDESQNFDEDEME